MDRKQEPAAAVGAAAPDADPTSRVCVIGAGPAGLAAARALRESGVAYEQLERHDRVGGIWDIEREGGPMYDSATFISSRTISAFHRFPMPASYPDYPGHQQILEYCERFAAEFGLLKHIAFGVEVQRIVPEEGGSWLVTVAPAGSKQGPSEVRRYAAVVCASGAQWTPRVPEKLGLFAGDLLPARDYRSPASFAGQRVLVVGAGNSGCDIAADLGGVAARCVLSLRRGYWFVPKYLFGRPADTLGTGGAKLPRQLRVAAAEALLRLVVGRPQRHGLPRPDHRLFESHPNVGTRVLASIASGVVTPQGDIAAVSGRLVTFASGDCEEFDTIIAATGYEPTLPYAPALISGVDDSELYLAAFARRHRNLFVLGLGESNGGGFPNFDLAAFMVAQYLADTRHNPGRATRFAQRIHAHYPDLTGGARFTESPRHQGYVDAAAYAAAAAATFAEMGWSSPRVGPVPSLAGVSPAASTKVAQRRAPARYRAGRFDFSTAVVVVTGAAGGLGTHICHQLARRGATVVALDSTERELVDLVAALPARWGQCHRSIGGIDLADATAAGRIAAELRDLPRLDALISNAGMAVGGALTERSDDELEREIHVNLVAPLQLLRRTIPLLKLSPHPRIVLTGSLGGVVAMGTDPVYAASKFGLRGAALSLHIALRAEGIPVTVVQPSAIDTPMLEREARVGAEPSQFLTAPQRPEVVAAEVVRSLVRPRPEAYPQALDGLLARLVMLAPGALPRVSALADRLGKPGMRRYIATLERRRS
ncbi:SDR family NAD(P)-dependent oxidoreductase [Leucobacter albus]|uniref:SDR family NAD(P)-dependent oxidoreductase n=1 Tax=Leucobacter albus TaxID=272210 RepID=A0ABW3TPH6_9MICO